MRIWIFLALMMNMNFNWAQAADKDGPGLKFVEAAAEAFRSGKTDEALKLAAKAVAAEPKNSSLHYFKGQLHSKLRQHAKAAAAYTKVLALKPDKERVADTHQER
ncbi:MAG: tetratricopeptide repeat protein, partial [Verrucomicrobiales bacterium]|nr:tetratricopeptide repeat protein [Verrucomicrobiales bacterium]